MSRVTDATIERIPSSLAGRMVVEHHYLHRRPMTRFCFGLFEGRDLVGVCIFGNPVTPNIARSVLPQEPRAVLELNRLWIEDEMPRNSESRFVSRCLDMLSWPGIVISFADTAYHHPGYIYRAANFFYAGLTPEEKDKAPVMADGTVMHPRTFHHHLPEWDGGYLEVIRSRKHR